MNIIYIEENEMKDTLSKIYSFLKIPIFRYNKIFVPVNYNKTLNKRIIKILNKIGATKIVISNKIKENMELRNLLKDNDFFICEGKRLFLYLAQDMLNYIVEKKKLDKNQLIIGVCSNSLNDIEIYEICMLANEYKRVCVVTEQIDKIRKIEEKLYKENGQMIVVSNNKQKSLLKCDIILNFDFCDEYINKYKINLEADIVSFMDNIKINKKRYSGIIIDNYEIEYNYGDIVDFYKYSRKEIYEANLNMRLPIKEVKEKLKKDNFKITQIYGKNGKIEL